MMKTDNLLVFGSFLFTFLAIFGSRPKNQSSNYADKAIGAINQKFKQDLNHFTESTVQFYEAAEKFQNKNIKKEQLISTYIALRSSFKQVEFFIEYLDKEAFDKALNGAPLPKLEEKVADLTILTPKGLQVIDELIGSDLNKLQREELLKNASKLMLDTEKMKRFLKSRNVTDRQFFEAARQAIIRMATLGITGFDTPGTTAGIDDARTVLLTQQAYFELYEPELKQVGRAEYLKRFKQVIQKGIERTKTEDF